MSCSARCSADPGCAQCAGRAGSPRSAVAPGLPVLGFDLTADTDRTPAPATAVVPAGTPAVVRPVRRMAPAPTPLPPVPSYGADLRTLITWQFQPLARVPALPDLTGTIAARVAALPETPWAAPAAFVWAAEARPGTVLAVDGQPARATIAAEPEAFLAQCLAWSGNITFELMALAGRADADAPNSLPWAEVARLEARLLDRYALDHRHRVLVPELLELLRGDLATPSGALLLAALDATADALESRPDVAGTIGVWQAARAELLRLGIARALDARQVAVGELVTDVLALQQAIALDVAEARERAIVDQELVGMHLNAMDRAATLRYETLIAEVLRPNVVTAHLTADERERAGAFLSGRTPLHRAGLLHPDARPRR